MCEICCIKPQDSDFGGTMRLLAFGAATLVLSVAAVSAQSNPYQATLKSCRAAAEASADPVGYKCNWKALIGGAHGAALSGRYDGRMAGVNAEMNLIEGGGPALIGITSVNKRSTNTCALTVTGGRGADDVLTAKSADEPKCVVRIVSSGLNQVRVTATNECQTFCGMSARFDGVYRLRR